MSLGDIDIYAEVGETSNQVFEMDENKCYSMTSHRRATSERKSGIAKDDYTFSSTPQPDSASDERKSSSSKEDMKSYLLVAVMLLVVMMLILAAACALALAEIFKLRTETASIQQQLATSNISLNYSITCQEFQEQLIHSQELVENASLNSSIFSKSCLHSRVS